MIRSGVQPSFNILKHAAEAPAMLPRQYETGIHLHCDLQACILMQRNTSSQHRRGIYTKLELSLFKTALQTARMV